MVVDVVVVRATVFAQPVVKMRGGVGIDVRRVEQMMTWVRRLSRW